MTPRNLTPEERERVFGPLNVVGAEGDQLRLDPPPPLDTVDFAGIQVRVHTKASESLEAVNRDLEELGLAGEVHEAVGFQPRIVRLGGGRTSPKPSAHAYGAAVDINFSENPVGSTPTDAQTRIAAVFEAHGWLWGDRFDPRDPHHFAFQGEDPTIPPTDASPREDFRNPGSGAPLVLGGIVLAWLLTR